MNKKSEIYRQTIIVNQGVIQKNCPAEIAKTSKQNIFILHIAKNKVLRHSWDKFSISD